MKLTDGKKTVEIKIQRWNGSGYDPDWSADYFNAGSLPYDEETDTYTVEDVDRRSFKNRTVWKMCVSL